MFVNVLIMFHLVVMLIVVIVDFLNVMKIVDVTMEPIADLMIESFSIF